MYSSYSVLMRLAQQQKWHPGTTTTFHRSLLLGLA